eukprot:4425267-Prymnesium_polylepis.1
MRLACAHHLPTCYNRVSYCTRKRNSTSVWPGVCPDAVWPQGVRVSSKHPERPIVHRAESTCSQRTCSLPDITASATADEPHPKPKGHVWHVP